VLRIYFLLAAAGLGGADDGAGSLAPRPNSAAAAASFDAAVAALGTENTPQFREFFVESGSDGRGPDQ
jgi:hypothetical protein